MMQLTKSTQEAASFITIFIFAQYDHQFQPNLQNELIVMQPLQASDFEKKWWCLTTVNPTGKILNMN
jgi:hypothetical protein